MNEQSIFITALGKQSDQERQAYLDEACGNDANLRAQVEKLLACSVGAPSFLEHPPAGLEATIETSLSGSDTVDSNPDSGSLPFLEPCDKPDRIGKLGQYEIIEVVGQGGMGSVLRAMDTKLSRVVAVKVMAPELAANPTAVKRFLREARSAAAVVHDHVVTIHAIEDQSRPPYLVMEFVQGQTLQQKIDREGALELRDILRIGSQMAAGLAAAHKTGLIHRDVKPGNILLENGVERVKITDFGLARASDDVEMTRQGMIAGTPQYMSPEQASGGQIDFRSDLFSLGSVLYTMCTGRPAFRAETTLGTLKRVTEDAPRPIREVNAELPDWLEAIVFKLLAKNPDDRFQTAKEVCELLEQHLAHLQQPSKVPLPPPVEVPGTDSTAIMWETREVFQACLVYATLGIVLLPVVAIPFYALLVFAGPTFDRSLPQAILSTAALWVPLFVVAALMARAASDGPLRSLALTGRSLVFSLGYIAIGLACIAYASLTTGAYVTLGANDPNVQVRLTSETGWSYRLTATEDTELPPGTYSLEAYCGPDHDIELLSIDDPTQHDLMGAPVKRTYPQGQSKDGIRMTLAKRDRATIIVRVVPKEAQLGSSESGWVQLFDGQDYNGWVPQARTKDANPLAAWTIADGVLIAKGGNAGRSSLRSDKRYENFQLKLRFRFPRRAPGDQQYFGDTAFVIHREQEEFVPGTAGIHFCLGRAWENRGLPVNLYPRDAAKTAIQEPVHYRAAGEWNDLEVSSHSGTVEASVNGQQVLRLTDGKLRSGYIALEAHGTPIDFRDIAIKELPPDEPGWVQLFNGQDLTGWKETPIGPTRWRVEGNVLKAAPGQTLLPSVLSTQRTDFGDFHLRMELKTNSSTRASIHMRTDGLVKGVGQGIWLMPVEGKATPFSPIGQGDAVKARPVDVKPEQWYQLEIIARGNNFQVKINNQLVTQWIDNKPAQASGQITIFQMLQSGMLEFRKIEIKELPPDDA